MPYCMNMWNLYMSFMDLFLFSGFNRFMHFLSIYAYSWINLQARRTQFDSAWYRVGLGGRCKPGMALITIGEAVPQWGRVADWSSCRTHSIIRKLFSKRSEHVRQLRTLWWEWDTSRSSTNLTFRCSSGPCGVDTSRSSTGLCSAEPFLHAAQAPVV